MAEPPLTTVVIINYNRGRFLREALRSVVEQTTRVNVLVADNASTDETPDIVRSLRVIHPDIVFHTLPINIGLARLRNHAATLVTTEWLIFLDSDDWLDLSYVSKAEEWLRTHAAVDVLTTDMTIVRGEGERRVVRSKVPRYWDELLVRNTIVQTSVIRRSLVARLGGYDPTLDFEDWDFWIRVLQAGGRIARLPGSHVFWRDHGDNYSKACDQRLATAAIRQKHARLATQGE
jgi:glycosyltransferase involved in cell wall biosynthesis